MEVPIEGLITYFGVVMADKTFDTSINVLRNVKVVKTSDIIINVLEVLKQDKHLISLLEI